MLMSMLYLKLHTAKFLAVSTLACIGCKVEVPDSDLRVGELVTALASVDCRTEEDVRHIVANAVRSHRAVLFLHVDWAPMEPQRTRFADFAVQYEKAFPDSGLLFHYADCTPVTQGYAPLVELDGWKELQDTAGTSLVHGWGEVVWMAKGRVLHVERILNFESASSLIQKTNDVFNRRELK